MRWVSQLANIRLLLRIQGWQVSLNLSKTCPKYVSFRIIPLLLLYLCALVPWATIAVSLLLFTHHDRLLYLKKNTRIQEYNIARFKVEF